MIRTDQSHLPVVAHTHPGMTGKNNEDRFAVTALQLSAKRPIPVLFAILCDGIGGHRAGEVAAELAVDHVSQRVAESDGSQPLETLRSAIELASQEIYAQAQSDTDRQGMGATCACAWIVFNRLYTANVGDSRIYLLRKKAIRQLSNDHTWIQEAIDQGLLQPEQALNHPNAHVIRRYLGSPMPPAVDFRLRLFSGESDAQALANQGLVLEEEDRVLLCSDGLTDLVQDAEILTMLDKYPPDTAVRALVDLANQRGGHDNITIVLIQAPKGAFRQHVSVKKGLVAVLAALALVVILGLALALGLTNPGSRPTITPSALPPVTQTGQPAQTLPVVLSPAVGTVNPTATITLTPLAPKPTTGVTEFVMPTGAPGPTITAWPTNTVKP